MLIQNSLVCERTTETLSKEAQIFKTFVFSSVLSISTFGLIDQNPTDYLHENRIVVSQTVRPKSVSLEGLDQESVPVLFRPYFSFS